MTSLVRVPRVSPKECNTLATHTCSIHRGGSLGVSETSDQVARCISAPTPLSREHVYDFWREMATLRRKYRLDSNEILEALIDDDDSDVEEAPDSQIEGKLLYFTGLFL